MINGNDSHKRPYFFLKKDQKENIMPTEIRYQSWDGGSGVNDKQTLIGYCKEDPKEVLKKVYKEYFINRYKDLYRPVDYNFPNNVAGLVIKEITFNEVPGCQITGTLEDLDLSIAKGKNLNRDRKSFRDALENAIKWHTSYIDGTLSDRYVGQVQEVKEVTLNEDLQKYFGIYDNGYDDVYYVELLAKTKQEAVDIFKQYLEIECQEDLLINKGNLTVIHSSAFDFTLKQKGE